MDVTDWIILGQTVATFAAVGAALLIARQDRNTAKMARDADRLSAVRHRDVQLLRRLLVLIEQDRDRAAAKGSEARPRDVEARAIVAEFHARGGGVGGLVWEYYGPEHDRFRGELADRGLGTPEFFDLLRQATLEVLTTQVLEERRRHGDKEV